MTAADQEKRHIIKRRISREPEPQKPKYGDRTAEYDQIVERVLSEKNSRGSINALKDRMNMLRLMLEDCSNLIQKKKEIHQKRRRREHLERFMPFLYVVMAILMVLFAVLVTWLLLEFTPEGAVLM